MKTASAALQALLASRQFYAADLYTIKLAFSLPAPVIDDIRITDDSNQRIVDDGSLRLTDAAAASSASGGTDTLCFTTGDRDIVANGNTYLCGGPGRPSFERFGGSAGGTCTWKRGLEVDTLSFDVDPGSAMVGSMPFLTACRTGIFDGAELTLERAYMPKYGDVSAGTVVMFVGRFAEIDAGRSYATFQVASHLELLNQQVPRNLYQAGCSASLFDSACGLNRDAYAVAGTVAAGSAPGAIVTAALAKATGYFDLGVISFTSGPNGGLSRTIKAYTAPSGITLISPLPVAPQAGDTFTVWPGCDKTMGTCRAKFGNLARFRGAPFVPAAETAN